VWGERAGVVGRGRGEKVERENVSIVTSSGSESNNDGQMNCAARSSKKADTTVDWLATRLKEDQANNGVTMCGRTK